MKYIERMSGRYWLLVAAFLLPPWTAFIVCCYWYFWDIDIPATHTAVLVLDPSGAPTNTVKRGGKLMLARDSCVTDEGKAYYTRQLVLPAKKLIYFMPSGEVQLIKGCARRFNEITIPSFIEPGAYEYVVTVLFQNNPLVDTRFTLPIPTFEVTP